MTKSDNIDIRFKNFDEYWELKNLGSYGKCQSGIGFPDIEQGGKIGIPFYKVSDMNNKGNELEMTNANNYVSNEQILKRNWNPIKEVPAIIFAKVGAAIMLNRKRLCRYTFLLDNNTMAYKLGDQWNTDFAITLFNRLDLTTLIQVGALPSYNAKDIENIQVFLPTNKKEQEKIGSYFKLIDNLINKQKQKIEKLQIIKKFCLEKMFPRNDCNVPELRFNGFTEHWKQLKLTDFVTFFSGLTYKPSDVRKDGTLVLRSSNVFNGEIIHADDVHVNSSVVDCDNVKKGDIIVVVRNGSRNLIGKHAQIKQDMDNTVIGAFMTGLRCECPAFTNALLNSPHFDKEISINMGATINQITGYMFSKMKFYVPSLAEQQRIGLFFYKLDKLITMELQKIVKLQNIKESCLQKMFI